MQRELKFRICYSTFNGKEIYYPSQTSSFFIGLNGVLYENYGTVEKPMWESVFDADYIIQQYTGLKDKNGKEIYEGDFIKYEHPNDDQCVSRNTTNIVLVRWSKENQDNHPGFRIVDLWGQYGEREVIGNIFENPELLKNEH